MVLWPPGSGAAVQGVQGRIGVHRVELGCSERSWGAELEGAICRVMGPTECFLLCQRWEKV